MGGDWGRTHILDPEMRERISGRGFKVGLDVGCGEGRFCRVMQEEGITAVGIDPTQSLIERAQALDPKGDYVVGFAEEMPFEDDQFDLIAAYLTLIDIPDLDRGIAEMARVLKPGGTLLISNLQSFATAKEGITWVQATLDRPLEVKIDNYYEDRADWVHWTGVNIRNFHRPLSRYMSVLLANGLELTEFAEPMPRGATPDRAERYRRVPYFWVMQWRKKVGPDAETA